MPDFGRIPYTVWVGKAVFKGYTNIISKIITAITAVLVIRFGGRMKYLSIDFITPLYSKRSLKNTGLL